MVEPWDHNVTSPTDTSPLHYYPNHYPFVQTAETHGDGLKKGLEWGFEDTLATSGASVNPATGATWNIMNNAGGLGLVDDDITGLLHEYVRGPHRTFWLPINVAVRAPGNCGTGPQGQAHCANLLGARVYYNREYHTVWLWKRTYHRFVDWGQNEAAEYVYRYALPAP